VPNVIKAVAVKCADFNVLDRLGLDRQFSRLRANSRDKHGEAAEQKPSRVHANPEASNSFLI